MIKTCLVDDHKVFCDGLERLLVESRHFQILQKFYSGLSLMEAFPSLRPDLLIMDIEMPGINGLNIIKRIQLDNPSVKIVILSMHEESAYVQEAYLLGAGAYLSKTVESDLLINSLLKVCDGERIFPAITIFEKEKPLLSDRESEVLKLIARGKTTPEIANLLSISEFTVKAHRKNMIRKLKAKNSSDLIVRSIEKGLI